jgi:hypothetical protein
MVKKINPLMQRVHPDFKRALLDIKANHPNPNISIVNLTKEISRHKEVIKMEFNKTKKKNDFWK